MLNEIFKLQIKRNFLQLIHNISYISNSNYVKPNLDWVIIAGNTVISNVNKNPPFLKQFQETLKHY